MDMALPAFLFQGDAIETTPKGLVMVFGNLCIHGDGDIGNKTSEELLADPLSTTDRIGFGVLRMRDQPRRMSQDPFPVGNLKRLSGWEIPVFFVRRVFPVPSCRPATRFTRKAVDAGVAELLATVKKPR